MTNARQMCIGIALLLGVSCTRQRQPAAPNTVSTTVIVPGGCLTVRRTGPAEGPGCYMAGVTSIGIAPAAPLYWHLDTFSSRQLAEAARPGRGLVVEAHGRVWLFTIAEAEWRPPGGARVAQIGPLPLTSGRKYIAQYIEAVVPPEARTPAHRHSGPEAWYVVEGTNCVMTPQGVSTAGPGETLIVPEGEPMVLTGLGKSTRRTFAVIVHDAAMGSTSAAPDWNPTSGCAR